MTSAAATWAEITAVAQVLLIPAIIYLARVLGKIGDRLDALEKDQVRTNTLLETRQNQRVEDRQDMRELFQKLEIAVGRLHDRLENDAREISGRS